jgi:sarcosine oxidase delta subunit
MTEEIIMGNSSPKCPYCRKRLAEVFENEYNTYIFDPASAMYRKHEWKGEIEIFCPYCDAELYDVFPDGVCNYVSRGKSRCAEGMNGDRDT